jgi:hypothetical protein
MVSNKNRITKYKHIDFQEDAAKAFMELHDPEKETLSDTMLLLPICFPHVRYDNNLLSMTLFILFGGFLNPYKIL